MENKVLKTLSIALGVIFLISFFSKILIIKLWLNFNYTLLESKIGYLNALIILSFEFWFAIRFLRIRLSNQLLILSFLFVFVLTVVVILNKNLFQSCLCFGNILQIAPNWKFIIKNLLLMSSIGLAYILFHHRQQINKKIF